MLSALRDDPDDAASRAALLDHLSEQGEELPAVAYRIDWVDYEEDQVLPLLAAFLADPAACLVRALVFGCWGMSDTSSDEIVEALVAARDRLPSLRALFLGDIPYEDCEISWITQSDLTPLFDAFPRLEHRPQAVHVGDLVDAMLRGEALQELGQPAAVVLIDLLDELGVSLHLVGDLLDQLAVVDGPAQALADRLGDGGGVAAGRSLPGCSC
jgi:hypothetical protein